MVEYINTNANDIYSARILLQESYKVKYINLRGYEAFLLS